jgi:hypothetical protein
MAPRRRWRRGLVSARLPACRLAALTRGACEHQRPMSAALGWRRLTASAVQWTLPATAEAVTATRGEAVPMRRFYPRGWQWNARFAQLPRPGSEDATREKQLGTQAQAKVPLVAGVAATAHPQAEAGRW